MVRRILFLTGATLVAAAIEVDERGGQARFRMGGEEIVYSLHERRFLEEARQLEKSGN